MARANIDNYLVTFFEKNMIRKRINDLRRKRVNTIIHLKNSYFPKVNRSSHSCLTKDPMGNPEMMKGNSTPKRDYISIAISLIALIVALFSLGVAIVTYNVNEESKKIALLGYQLAKNDTSQAALNDKLIKADSMMHVQIQYLQSFTNIAQANATYSRTLDSFNVSLAFDSASYYMRYDFMGLYTADSSKITTTVIGAKIDHILAKLYAVDYAYNQYFHYNPEAKKIYYVLIDFLNRRRNEYRTLISPGVAMVNHRWEAKCLNDAAIELNSVKPINNKQMRIHFADRIKEIEAQRFPKN